MAKPIVEKVTAPAQPEPEKVTAPATVKLLCQRGGNFGGKVGFVVTGEVVDVPLEHHEHLLLKNRADRKGFALHKVEREA